MSPACFRESTSKVGRDGCARAVAAISTNAKRMVSSPWLLVDLLNGKRRHRHQLVSLHLSSRAMFDWIRRFGFTHASAKRRHECRRGGQECPRHRGRDGLEGFGARAKCVPEEQAGQAGRIGCQSEGGLGISILGGFFFELLD